MGISMAGNLEMMLVVKMAILKVNCWVCPTDVRSVALLVAKTAELSVGDSVERSAERLAAKMDET